MKDMVFSKFLHIVMGFLLLVGTAICQGEYVVLDSTAASQTVDQCSRWSPEISGSWNPSRQDIGFLELNLSGIEALKADSSRMPPFHEYEHIQHPEKYLRQYVGILVNGRQYIYVNAFPRYTFETFQDLERKWKSEPIIMCDGGSNFWGVLYDPETKVFSELSTNGDG